MAQIAETSLEARIAALEAQARSLAASNWTDRASVTNASGRFVPLSSLAFGQVVAEMPPVVELWGVANAGPGGVGWIAGDPTLDVYVSGGGLRVDVGAALTASGNKCSMFMSYAVIDLSVGQTLVAPDYARSIEVQHNAQGMDQRAAMGTFGFDLQLVQGWYRVQARYALSYSGWTSTPYGSAERRRIAATPF